MLELSAEERDVITELLNIGVGQAAASFSEMVGEEVLLSVPSVEIMARDTAAALLARLTSDRATGITQSFDGALVGVAALVFPEAKSMHIVRSVLRSSYPLDEINELAQETLLEIGNIILNACLGTISNFLGTEVVSSLPTLTTQVTRDLFTEPEAAGGQGGGDGGGGGGGGGGSDSDTDSITLFLHIRFQISSNDIDGYLVFVMDMVGVERFRRLVTACLQAVGGTG